MPLGPDIQSPQPGDGGDTREARELRAIVRIAHTVVQHTDLDAILSAITRELSSVINFDRCSVSLLSPDRNHLVLRHIHKGEDGVGHVGEGREILIDEKSVLGWVALHREPVVRSQIATDGRFLEVVKEEPLASDIILPLVARGNLVGTLNVGSYTPGALTDDDLPMLVNCSSMACAAIEHAQLIQQANDLTERYRTLQRNASDIIMLIDKNSGRLIEVNRKCCEALGYSEEDLLKRTFFELFPHEDQLQARRDFVNMLSQKSRTFVDRRLSTRDGSILYADISVSLIEIKADTFVQALVHDISQRRMLEQQIILQNKNLQQANRKLREVDQMKTEFLANISHELRTPLSIIIAYAESLRARDISDEEHLQFLDVISENGESLLQLINDLLELSKLEVSGAMLSFTLSHIHDVVRSLWPRALLRARTKELDLSFEAGDGIPVIYIDNKRMGQVMSCLIQNAIKFTETGGRVSVITECKPDGVWVSVTDTGPGIPDEHLPHIFDTFHQIDSSSTRRWGGLGIGLAMVKHIVELHGGRIWVESEEGVGSRFTLVLPVETDANFKPMELQGTIVE